MSINYTDADFLEHVYLALFMKLAAAKFPASLKFNTALRVVDVPDDVPAGAQPALYQIQGPIAASQKEFGAQKWEASVLAIIYARADAATPSQQETLPDTVANYLIWGVYQALKPDNDSMLQTLGGIAYHAWIDGQVVPAVADEQMIIAVPMKVLF